MGLIPRLDTTHTHKKKPHTISELENKTDEANQNAAQ